MEQQSRNNYSNSIEKMDAEDSEICELEHLRKLFIGGLNPQTTEESLQKYFQNFGKVESVNIMRDQASSRSRGFGFVTFKSSAMVDNCQSKRPHVIDDKTVQTKRVLPKPDRDNITVEKLFVGGLKDIHDEDTIRDYFSQFGNIVSIKILTDKNTGKRRGFAYVEYDDYDAVDKAILQKIHSLKNIAVDVKKSVYNQDQMRQPVHQQNYNLNDPDANARKLFIGGLKNVHDEYSLRNYFSQFGQIVSLNILTDKATGKRRGFGYIEFFDGNGVDNTLSQPAHRIKNILVDVKRSVYSPDQTRPQQVNNMQRVPTDPNVMVKKVFVGGVRNAHDELSLRSHFSQFGNVTSVKIVVDKNTGKRRGFAYVEFSDFDGVERAVAYPAHRIRNFLVDVKKSVYNQEHNGDNYSQHRDDFQEPIGSGYEQSFNGGPTKHGMNVNRPIPYNSMANNNFANGMQVKQGMIY